MEHKDKQRLAKVVKQTISCCIKGKQFHSKQKLVRQKFLKYTLEHELSQIMRSDFIETLLVRQKINYSKAADSL